MVFLEDMQFNRDVVDLLVQVTADTLGLEIFIYHKHNEKIKILKYSGGTCCKPVYLKFTHNAKQSQGNHYDSIIKEKIKEEVISIDDEGALEMSSEVKIVSPNKTKIENKEVFNFPASKSNVVNTQTVNAEMDVDTDEVLDLSMKVPIKKAPPGSKYNPDEVLDLSMKAPSQTAPPATQERPASQYLP